MEEHKRTRYRPDPKKFKEYFKEFIMIFLAVVLGFLAQNFRDSIDDRNHVAELAGQLKQDLQNDTANLQHLIDNETIQVARADSLYALLRQPIAQIDFRQLEHLLIVCDNIEIFYPSTGASSTIKSELHLKRFVRTRIASHITNYEKEIALLRAFENRNLSNMTSILENFMQQHFTPENAAAVVDGKPFVNEKMRNITAANLEQLSVDINLIKAYSLQMMKHYGRIKAAAGSFINHLNHTYDLDND